MRRLLRLTLACSLLFAPAGSVAQERPTSGYEGVTPGAGHPPPAARRLGARARRGRAQILTWPGFQMRPDGGSRFFVQTTGPVTTDVRVTADRVEVRFRDTGIHLRNSARWLETEFFETPVRRARLERRGRDMVLVMQLRGAETPTVSSAPGAAGEAFQYTYVDFAPGQWAPAAPALEPAPAGSVGVVIHGSATSAPPPSGESQQGQHVDDERPPTVGPRP